MRVTSVNRERTARDETYPRNCLLCSESVTMFRFIGTWIPCNETPQEGLRICRVESDNSHTFAGTN